MEQSSGQPQAEKPKGKKIYGQIAGGLIVLFALFVLFGNIPMNFYKTYKASKEYKQSAYDCMQVVKNLDSSKIGEFICNCSIAGASADQTQLTTADEIKVRLEFYGEMKKKYNISNQALSCESRDNMMGSFGD